MLTKKSFTGWRLAVKTPTAPIHVKRVYDPPGVSDGTRILIDRLWPRGLRRKDASFSCWLKEISPTPQLRAWFGHDPKRYEEFARRYRAELARNEAEVARLEDLLKQGPVTLLYAAHDQAHNHALVLVDYLRKRMRGGDG